MKSFIRYVPRGKGFPAYRFHRTVEQQAYLESIREEDCPKRYSEYWKMVSEELPCSTFTLACNHSNKGTRVCYGGRCLDCPLRQKMNNLLQGDSDA